jgi:hypothetical protein
MVDRFRPGDGGRPKVRGLSPVGAGLQLSVLGVSSAITAPLSGRLVGRGAAAPCHRPGHRPVE